MSEEVLGVVKVVRTGFYSTTYETLYFTPDRTVVARIGGGGKSMAIGGLLGGALGAGIAGAMQGREAKKKGEQYSKVSLESILKADKNNYAIPHSEITEVELKKDWRSIGLNIKTSKKHGETKWHVFEEKWKDASERYESMLRPVFKDRLIVKE